MCRPHAFTLIELLIVVAIIAILAAIAIPNFIEAQARAKVSRCKSDLRSMATALEAYAVDANHYPPYGCITLEDEFLYPALRNNKFDKMCFVGPSLTTPVAYISSVPIDPFVETLAGPSIMHHVEYLNMKQHVANFPRPLATWMTQLMPAWGMWRMVAAGPDRDRGLDIKNGIVYDTTNGTVSDGDVVRSQRFVESAINPYHP